MYTYTLIRSGWGERTLYSVVCRFELSPSFVTTDVHSAETMSVVLAEGRGEDVWVDILHLPFYPPLEGFFFFTSRRVVEKALCSRKR